MTEDSNPTDSGVAERVNGIIKNEFLEPLPTPRNLQEALPMCSTQYILIITYDLI